MKIDYPFIVEKEDNSIELTVLFDKMPIRLALPSSVRVRNSKELEVCFDHEGAESFFVPLLDEIKKSQNKIKINGIENGMLRISEFVDVVFL